MSPPRRPPRLEAEPSFSTADAPTLEQLLDGSQVTGRGTGPGTTELRRLIARIVAGEATTRGALPSFPEVTDDEAVVAIRATFGASTARPEITAAATVRAATHVAAVLADAGARGTTVLAATARPATLLALHRSLAAIATRAGASVIALEDSGALRLDGRRGRRLRSVDGVVCVTDGASLLATDDPMAATELLFSVPRPGLVVADGPFALAAVAAGLPVVAVAGLEDAILAVAARRLRSVTVLPVDPTRPPAAYGPLLQHLEALAPTLGTNGNGAPNGAQERT